MEDNYASDSSNKKKENIKFSKFVTSLSFMKKNTEHHENAKKKIKYSNDNHMWIVNEYEEAAKAYLKKESPQKSKKHVSLNCLGRKTYNNYNNHVNLYNIEIIKFINSVKRNKPISSLKE
ncbi:conserved Plasmodium protein, unknown function [Plasmodium sp. gorilla clade G1]|nr:conserved Plasmodium protein, unknown function [Plasmodium sp. gorilla clade G1]